MKRSLRQLGWVMSLVIIVLSTLAPPSVAGKPGGGGGGGAGKPPKSYVDLAISMTGSPDPVMEGRELTYGILVENKGTAAASGVIMSDPLNAEVTGVSPGGECDMTVTCNLGEIAAGQSRWVSITVKADADYPSNTATVTSNQADRTTGNNSVTVQTTIHSSIDLAIEVSDSPDPYVAPADLADGTTDGITYLISVTNLSDTASGPVLANMQWIDRQIVVGDISSIQATCQHNGYWSGAVLEAECVVPSLGPGQSFQIVATAEVCALNTEIVSLFVDVARPEDDPPAGYPSTDPDWDNNHDAETTIASGGTDTSCPS